MDSTKDMRGIAFGLERKSLRTTERSLQKGRQRSFKPEQQNWDCPQGFWPNRGSLSGPAVPYGDQLCPGKRAHGFAKDALSQKGIKSVLGQPWAAPGRAFSWLLQGPRWSWLPLSEHSVQTRTVFPKQRESPWLHMCHSGFNDVA